MTDNDLDLIINKKEHTTKDAIYHANQLLQILNHSMTLGGGWIDRYDVSVITKALIKSLNVCFVQDKNKPKIDMG